MLFFHLYKIIFFLVFFVCKINRNNTIILVKLKNTIYHLYERKTESVKQSKIITQEPKTFENPNIIDISVIIEDLKTSHKLSSTIRQVVKFSKVGSSLYSDTKISKKLLTVKKLKITKRARAFKGHASSYNVEILNSFNPDLQHKDIEFAI